MKGNNGQLIYQSLGQSFEVVFVSSSIEDINAFLEKNEGTGVIDTINDLHFVAKLEAIN